MTHDTFLIICAAFIGIPFIVSCIKGNPIIGFTAGLVAFFAMGFAAGHAASMLEVHVIGFVICGLGVAWSLHGR